MRHAVTASKTTGQSEHRTESPSAGRDAVAIAPPSYGIDFVDRASKPLSGAPAARSGAISAIQRAHAHPVLQAKLTVNQPGDVYEQEADRVADQVMRMPAPGKNSPTSHAAPSLTPTIQRRCSKCEEEAKLQRSAIPEEERNETSIQREPIEEEEMLQAETADGSTPTVTPGVESRIRGLRGLGTPLDPTTRSFMEPRFGQDFSNVRVHTDARASHLARAVNAKAFTTGSDIVFRSGQYNPTSPAGKHLLAHELTHVVQQQAGSTSVQRDTDEANENPDTRSKENQASVLIKNATDAIENGGGKAKFHYLAADPHWNASFIMFADFHVHRLHSYLLKQWFGVTTWDAGLEDTEDMAIPPRWVGEFRARALNVMPKKPSDSGYQAYLEQKQLAELAVKLADSVAAETFGQKIRRQFVEEADRRVGTTVMTKAAIDAKRKEEPSEGFTPENFTTCIEFFVQVTGKISKKAGITSPLLKGPNHYKEIDPVEGEEYLPPGAWHPCTPNSISRPKPGDLLIFSFTEHERHPSGEIKFWKGGTAHIAIMRSIESFEITSLDKSDKKTVVNAFAKKCQTAKNKACKEAEAKECQGADAKACQAAKDKACNETNSRIQRWTWIDGGGTTAKRTVGYFCPSNCLIRYRDLFRTRTLKGWIDIEKAAEAKLVKNPGT